MVVLVTGAAGFIGYHTCEALLARDKEVVGVDTINNYYDQKLKLARLEQLRKKKGFSFYPLDITNYVSMLDLCNSHPDINYIINLAAQVGVRYSMLDPFSYHDTNLRGYLVILELCRSLKRFRHLIYASSSSVYGANCKQPFSVGDSTNTPVSAYAVTKKAGELMSYCYSHLYRIPATGLRFFTVYGPWGRPDMAIFLFTSSILAGRVISVFNKGNVKRDFTYIDDAISAIISCIDKPPKDCGENPPQRIYNVGNGQSKSVSYCIKLLEKFLNRQAKIHYLPMQVCDVLESCADIAVTTSDLGYKPITSLEAGVPKFISWYKEYHGVVI